MGCGLSVEFVAVWWTLGGIYSTRSSRGERSRKSGDENGELHGEDR